MTGQRKPLGAALVFAALFLLAGASPVYAQALYGSIVGTVTDSSEAAVPQAKVRITQTGTNESREATTNEVGGFSFPSIPSGAYDVTITKEGFQTFTRRGVVVTINSVVRVNTGLQVGAVTETIQVASQAATLQTDRAEVRSEVATKTLEEMPVPVNRNYQNLFILVPGFTPPSNAHSVSANPTRGLNFNVNGATRNANTIRIEGASATNVWLPHVTAYVPGLEAIETVSVVSSSLDAEQGLAGAAAVNVQMKSGTNAIHGSLFEYHTNNQLKAKPFFLPVYERNPKNIDNHLGGTVGGPIKKEKLFYFFGYDGQYQRQTANSSSITVPTPSIRAGDMAGSAGVVYDPTTGAADGSGKTPFPNNRVPASSMDPIVQKILAAVPQPTWPERTTSNYYANGALAITRHKFDSKISWNTSSKLRISGRAGVLDYRMTSPPAFGETGSNISSFAGREGKGFGSVINSTISGTYVSTPTLVMDTYFGYTRLDTGNEPPLMDKNIGRDVLGIPGTNGTSREYGGWPQFSVSSYSVIGKGSSPIYYLDPTWEYVANFNWAKGSHNLRWGVDVSRQMMNNFEAAGAGTFSFSGGSTAIRGQSTNQYNSFADFLMGYVSSGSTDSVAEAGGRATSRTWAYSLFVRDQWQASRKLTMSLGVRWDYFPMGVRKKIGFQQYDWNNNKVRVCGLGSVPKDCGIQVPKLDFSPRLGFAYRATDTFVVRAGYGINYDPQPLSFARNLLSVYPAYLGIGLPAPANSNKAAGLLKNGLPPIPAPANLNTGIIDIPATVGIYSPPDRFRMGYIQSWNFTLQKQFFWGLIGQAGYVGTRQIKILQAVNQNAQRVGGGRDSQPLYQKFGRTADTYIFTNFGRNWYDSLQATLTRSFANGFQVNMAYTWSKAIAICCDDLSDKNPAIQIPEYAGLNKALAGFHRTHVFSTAIVAELPFGRGKRWVNGGGAASRLAGGWQVNSLLSVYTGTPFSVTASGTSLNASGNTQRADQVKPEVAILGRTGPEQSWFDPFAFAPVTQARFGTAGFNTVRSPGLVNLDVGLVRDFRAGERIEIQFRGEALNFSNTPHFGRPGNNVSNLQLNPDGSIRNLGGYTVISSTPGTGREGIDERVFRLGLRVRF